MDETEKPKEKGFTTKLIHDAHDKCQWTNLDIVPPIGISQTYYQPDPTEAAVSIGTSNQNFFPKIKRK